jgi:multidrug transporter EmrE-like cation transporter
MKQKILSVFLIILSIFISWFISMSANLNTLELGALINLIYPFLVGFGTIGFYLIGTWIFKGSKSRLLFLIIAILLNLSTGLYIRFVDF